MTIRIPSVSECQRLFEQFAMLDNIRNHSILVAAVAGGLVDGLIRTAKTPGPPANREETIASALLHDIAKTLCIKTGCHHADIGREICIDLGFPEIGEIVAEHVVLKNFSSELYRQGVFGAKELVFYADKRVRHDEVVSLTDRLDYILERYGDGNPAKEHHIRLNFNRTLELERYLFSYLDFTPEQVSDHLAEPILPV